jgi:hypothetical protein
MPTGASRRAVVCRRWFRVRKTRIIGAADGTIMATIIAAHITKRRTTAIVSHGMIMPGISISAMAAFE